MRYTPMTMQEQCALELEMLEHFGFVREYDHVTKNIDGTFTTRKERACDDMQEVNKALDISQSFMTFAQSDDPPLDLEEMVLSIRYEMGYGWWAWLFVRHFAVPIIKWLWKRYHETK
jgi:hypothetical protein